MNPKRVPLIAGNWKMFHGGASGVDLAAQIAEGASRIAAVEVVVLPPFTALAAVAMRVEEVAEGLHTPPIGVGAQNLHAEKQGAFTGEISGPMIVDAGCRWVVVGHSERRQLFGEDDALVSKKAHAALSFGLHPIVCVGETLAERQAGHTLDVVTRQLRAVLDVVVAGKGGVVLAYEPIWAIGTGKVATPADAQEVHGAIRALIAETDRGLAEKTRILYGGSVKPDNARALLGQADVDGALVGGASLEAASFLGIVRGATTVPSA
jgi:triosephosphate isomerase